MGTIKYWSLAALGALLMVLAIYGAGPQALVSTVLAVSATILICTAFFVSFFATQRLHQFQLLADQAIDGMAIVRDGLITYANPPLATLLQIPATDLAGRRLTDYLLSDGGQSLTTGWPDDGEMILKAGDGTRIPIQIKTTTRLFRKPLQLVSIRDIRHQRAAAEQIRSLNEYMDSIIDNADIWLSTLDEEGRIVIWNKAAERISGYRREDMVGKSDVWALLYPDPAYREYVFSRAMDVVRQGSVALEFVTTIRTRFGRDVTLSWNSRRLTDSSGRTVGSITLARDVTLERQAQESLRQHASAFQTVDPIAIMSPEGTLLRINQAFIQEFGYSETDVVDRPLKDFHIPETEDDPQVRIWQALKLADQWMGELMARRADGTLLPVQLTLSTVRDEQGSVTHYVAHWKDISKRRAFEEQIQRQALYDPLTGLPNRRLALSRLAQEVGRSNRIGGYGALIFMDLDRFKRINDVHGHRVGDTMLRELAGRIQSALRAEDMAARLGGDEFVILVGAEAGDRDAAFTRAQRVAEKVLNVVRRPVTVGNYELHVSASAGLALYPEPGISPEDFLQRADSAMYRAKEQGRDGIRFFSPALQARAHERQGIHDALVRALDAGRLDVEYQPVTDSGGRLRAVEALARWPELEAGGLETKELISVAEATGLIGRLDLQVLQIACDHLAQWGRLGLLPAKCMLMLDLSYQLLALEQFPAELAQILERTGAPAERLVLDVDESVFRDQHPALESAMTTLSDLGIRFAVDDFGAGHSSPAQLKRLPITALKLSDKHIRELPGEENSVAVVEACLGVGRSLGLDVVAKGVETEAQLRSLRERACPYYQGRYLSPPLKAAALESLFREGAVLRHMAAT